MTTLNPCNFYTLCRIGILDSDLVSKLFIIQIKIICTHFFAPSEQAVLLQHKGEGIREAFYRCWTRKEAYLKASGEGLSRALDSFHVTLTAHEPAKLTYVKNEPEEVERWNMRHIPIGREYTAALCVEGEEPTVVCWKMR